jgi:uncharacterized lipoprotein YddW (UPF0748 family)
MALLPALVLLSAAPALAASRLPEVRGLWVVRTALVSPESVDRVVDAAVDGGITDLFVQVRGRGDAFYGSKLVGRSPLLSQQPAAFDPLARLLERAHGRHLQVHAWVNVLLTAHFGVPLPSDHVLRQHPEWLMVPRGAAARTLGTPATQWLGIVGQAGRSAGEAEGYYLSPSAPGVGEYLEGVVREIVRTYRVDGLHLDFIRYPGPEYDYSRAALEQFRKQRGGTGDLLGGPARTPGAWDDYRRETLTILARRLADGARAVRSGMIVSVAVVPDEAQAVSQKYQDWPAWISEGLVAAVCPMAYTPDSRLFRAQVEQARARVPAGRALWAGIGAYRLTLAGIVERIQLARESGASGVVLFSHESLTGPDWKKLQQEAFPPVAAAAAVTGPLGPATRGATAAAR